VFHCAYFIIYMYLPYLNGILCILCIFIGIFEYYKFTIIYYIVIYYSIYIN